MEEDSVLGAKVDSEVRVDLVTDLAAREDLVDPEEDSAPAVGADSEAKVSWAIFLI